MKQSLLKRPTLFYTTNPSRCPYLPNKYERKIITNLSGPDSDNLHEFLAKGGFRRSHSIAYLPACSNCTSCIPVRVKVTDFTLNKSLSRVWKHNHMISSQIIPAYATIEQYELFCEYQLNRHSGSDMSKMTIHEYSSMIEDSPIDTNIIEFRNPKDELVAVSLIDRTSDGLSAVYSFYSSQYKKQSLGNFTTLWTIKYTQKLKLPYLYLGYWIKKSKKMSYKSRFKPLEYLSEEGWTKLLK